MGRCINRPDFLPNYTRGEEIANMITHILGTATGIVVLLMCLLETVPKGDIPQILCSCIYGVSMILLFTVSSIYHGLKPSSGKRVMRVIDHCTIYFLIAGTYTPILLIAVRPIYPAIGWVLFGVVWGLAIVATVFTAIDLMKFSIMSMACYVGMGWCIIFALKPTIDAMSMTGFLWLLAGGIAYTIGAILYKIGKRKRYIHSIFHIFVDAGCLLQAYSIIKYVL